eukprot:scaffold7655_cov417-Prasinococcus_capsulatus_cf.AAC.6
MSPSSVVAMCHSVVGAFLSRTSGRGRQHAGRKALLVVRKVASDSGRWRGTLSRVAGGAVVVGALSHNLRPTSFADSYSVFW